MNAGPSGPGRGSGQGSGQGQGSGRPSGGGGGRSRRRRGRRPPNPRGPRSGGGPSQARHNQDGIYTAPMDHSYRAALSGNGNGGGGGRRQRPGFAAPFAPVDP